MSTTIERRRASGAQLFWLSLGALAPATVLAAGPAVVMASAGSGTWLSYVGAAVIALAVAACVAVFARRRAVSGSLYSYVTEGLGRRAGLLTGWALVIGYAGVVTAVVAGVGLYVGSFLSQIGIDGSATLAQAATYAVIALGGGVLATRGVQESARATLAIQAVSIALLGVVLVASLAEHGLSLAPQLSLEGSSLGDVGLGMTITFISLVGFESSAALGAEARDPRRAIPRLLFLVPGVLGLLYTLCALVQVPVLALLSEPLLAGGSPSTVLATDAGLGGITEVVDLALAASFAAAALGLINFASRVVAAMAADGVAPAALGRAHPRRGTPTATIALFAAAAFTAPTLMLVLSDETPLGVFTLLGTPGSFGFLFAYVLVAGAAVRVRRREGRAPAALVASALVAAGGAAWVYANSILNPAPAPYDAAPYVFAGLMAAGAIVVAVATREGRSPLAARAV